MRLQLVATVFVVGLLRITDATNLTDHEGEHVASIFDENEKSTEEAKNANLEPESITANSSNEVRNFTVDEEMPVSVTELNRSKSLTEVTNALISALERLGNIEDIVELLKISTEIETNKTFDQQERMNNMEEQLKRQTKKTGILQKSNSWQRSLLKKMKRDSAKQKGSMENLNAENAEQRTLLKTMKQDLERQKNETENLKEENAEQRTLLRTMKHEIARQKNETENLKGENAEQRRILQTMKQDMYAQASGISNLVNNLENQVQKQAFTLQAHKIDIDSQKSQCSKLSGEIANLKHRNERLGNEITIQKNTNTNQATQLNKLATTVAFAAYLTQTKHVKEGETLTFDGTVLNHGGRFDIHKGTFTCPYDGIYHFEFSALTGARGALDLHIQHNSRSVARAWTQKGENMGSAGVIIKADQGDTVKIVGDYYTYSSYNGRGGLQASELAGNRYSSFRGYLMARL